MSDLITVLYHEKQHEMYTGRTFAVIHEGNMRFIGISICAINQGDQFSRKRGRLIATGRAKHAYDEFHGKKEMRWNTSDRLEFPLMDAYNVVTGAPHSEVPAWMVRSTEERHNSKDKTNTPAKG